MPSSLPWQLPRVVLEWRAPRETLPCQELSPTPAGRHPVNSRRQNPRKPHHRSPAATPGPPAPGNGGSVQGTLPLRSVSARGVMVTSCIQNFHLLLTYQSLITTVLCHRQSFSALDLPVQIIVWLLYPDPVLTDTHFLLHFNVMAKISYQEVK